jgi:hypothetical protein
LTKIHRNLHVDPGVKVQQQMMTDETKNTQNIPPPAIHNSPLISQQKGTPLRMEQSN